MKLTSAHITNFRSVDDSGSFEIRDVRVQTQSEA